MRAASACDEEGHADATPYHSCSAPFLLPLCRHRSMPLEPPVSAQPAAAPGGAASGSRTRPNPTSPGIEQFMNVIQTEHAKLWYAGRRRATGSSRPIELGEIKEIMGGRRRSSMPVFKDLPLARHVRRRHRWRDCRPREGARREGRQSIRRRLRPSSTRPAMPAIRRPAWALSSSRRRRRRRFPIRNFRLASSVARLLISLAWHPCVKRAR